MSTKDKHIDCNNTDDKNKGGLLYKLNDVPPWHISLLMGFQHYLMFASSCFIIPLIISPQLCIEVGTESDEVAKAELIGTIGFVAGIITFLQTTFGSRLPIVQGASVTFIAPTFHLLSSFGDCPLLLSPSSNLTEFKLMNPNNTYVVISGSDEHREVWKMRMRAIQGAIMLASVFQVVIGFSGLMGFMLKYIGPLVITLTIALIGLPLFPIAAANCAHQWGIALLTVTLVLVFSQYLGRINVPVYSRDRGRCSTKNGVPIFALFPIILAIIIAYVLCVILTYTDVFPDDKNHLYYKARTDGRLSVLTNAQWFRFPYPGQWGVPTVTVAGVFGMLAAIVGSMIESVGDYYAAARLAGAPAPTTAAINRGIGMEGVGCVLSAAWGAPNGTASYSGNIAAMEITKVGSRRIIQICAGFMIVLSVFGKFCAVFVTIPDPILGGIYIIVFGMIAAVGFSNLQYVNLNSSRNLFVLGTSLMLGLAVPFWTEKNGHLINTGSDIVDEVFRVLLSTPMLIGGVIAFLLDNTIPGTLEERGMLAWNTNADSNLEKQSEVRDGSYDMPFGNDYIYRSKWTSYMPFCPNFLLHHRSKAIELNANDDQPSSSVTLGLDNEAHRDDLENGSSAL